MIWFALIALAILGAAAWGGWRVYKHLNADNNPNDIYPLF